MESEFRALSQFEIGDTLGQGSHLMTPQVSIQPTSLEEEAEGGIGSRLQLKTIKYVKELETSLDHQHDYRADLMGLYFKLRDMTDIEDANSIYRTFAKEFETIMNAYEPPTLAPKSEESTFLGDEIHVESLW